MSLLEGVGEVLGWAVSPAAAVASAARRARVFHPVGTVLRAEVTALPGAALVAVPDLGGPALVRLSGALWKRAERLPDTLGCAVRIGPPGRPPALLPAPGDQDLLFATIPSAALLLVSPLLTDVRDYLTNVYPALGEFEVEGGARVELRLRPLEAAPARRGGRTARLLAAVDAGAAALAIEARAVGPSRRADDDWTPVAAVRLLEALDHDPPGLAFDPFQAGRGVTPRGLVHAMRRAPYAASQRARGAGRSRAERARARARPAAGTRSPRATRAHAGVR